MLSYCDLSATPAFRNLVTELTPELGDAANKEAFRDYMEYNGVLRDYSDIIAKLRNNYFSIVKPVTTITGGQENEITDMTQTAKFRALGVSAPKKQISQQQIINLKKVISVKNNELVKAGINQVYTLETKQVGEALNDNFTWDLKVYLGKLDVEGKTQRGSDIALEKNRLPTIIQQGTKQLNLELTNEINISYGNEANFRKNLEKAQSQSNKLRWATLFGNVHRFRSRIIQALKRPTTVYGNTESVFEGGVWGTGRRVNSVKDLADMYLVHRSPLIEKLHFIYLKDGIVVGTNAYTAGLVNRTSNFDFESFSKNYETFKADEVYVLHNHPSGNHLPSPSDILMTSRITKASPNVNFKGQLVIDTDKFTFIPAQIEADLKNYQVLDYISAPKRLNKTRISLGKNSKQVKESLKQIGDLLLKNDNVNAVIYISTFGDVVGYDGFLLEDLDKMDFVSRMKEIGAFNYAIFSPDLRTGELVNKTSDKHYSERVAFYMKGDVMTGLPDYNYDIFDTHGDLEGKDEQLWEGSQGDIELSETITEANYSQQIIRKMADALGEQIGVDYAFVSPSEAKELTKNSANPWNGQNAFFFQGKSYFIEGTLTPDDILHEFVHPIIKSIAKQNRPLFDNLYGKAASSEEGGKIIEEVIGLYPDLDIKGNDFREEVLVRSLAKIQDLNNKGLEVSAKFEKFVNDLLFSIKQFLRKIFGQKIKVSELSPDTTLKGLSKMLEEGGSFELDPEIITDSELVAYKNEYTQYMKDFVAENADQKEVENLVNTYFETVTKQLKSLQEKNDLGALADILQNEYKTGELQKMKQNLKSYQTLILQDSKKMEDEVELTRQRTQAVINSLGNVDNMVKKIYEGLRELVKDIDNSDNVQRALYYQKVLNYWSDFVNTANTTLDRNGIDNIKMVNNVTANTRKANDLMDDFYRKASEGVLWEKLKVSAENIDQKWKERIAELTVKKAPQEQLDKANKDYQNEKITPEMIEKALKGELKDLNFANAYLEGYGYSPDPVVGGLALFVKDKITEVEVTAQKNFNEAATQLKSLLDKVGYNPNNPGKLGQDLGQKEKVGRVNSETGEFEEVEVWRFLNEFSGADLVRDQYLFKIKTASNKYNETGTEEDKKILADLQAEWEQHRRDYFHNEYTESFYQAYDILKKDDLGNEARMQMNNLYDELNLLSGQMSVATASDVLEIVDQVEVTRRQIKQLSSLYDLAGNLKTGNELLIAKRLQEFNEAVKDIYESEEIPGAFETALQSFEQKLSDEGKKKGESDYERLRTDWLEKNTRKAIKETFWGKMDLISKAINDILSTLPQQDATQLEIDEAYKVIKEMVKGNRDESGQPLGSELSPERQEKVKAAQERINAARENLNRLSGLNKQEQAEVTATMLKYQTGQKVSAEEQYRLNQLLEKQASLKLDKIQRAELNSLFAEMDELRAKEATDSYIDAVNNLFRGMNSEALAAVIGDLNFDKGNTFLTSSVEKVQELMNLSPEFEVWFLRNHIKKESVDMKTNELKEVWERTYAWNVIKPRDEKYYETTKIKNSAGETITVDGLPSLKYFKRLVKVEYLTEKIEGVTTDNRGYWLPKKIDQGAKDDRYVNKDYSRMRSTNPDMFRLLEKMKEIHLKNQTGLSKKAKLYLDMPRYRKQTVERLRSENPVQRLVQRVKDFWHNVKDNWDQGMNYSDNMQLIKMDLFDDNTTGIPISGLSNLDIEETSTDIAFTVMRYMLAAERSKQLTDIAPVARMIQAVVNNQKNYPLESKILNNSTLVNMGKKKDKYLRARAVNNMLERVLEGKENTGAGSESAIAQNVSRQIFKRAGSAYLDFNIPSAIKNALSAKFQTMIEASAGKHLSWKDFIAAEKDASIATMRITTEIYEKGPKSLDSQLIEVFDPERDRFHYAFGEALTRTPGKDYSFLIMNRLNDFRKITQLQASIQTLFGMMRHDVIKLADGSSIRYRDAWEVRDGKIQLKPNVPAEWGITYNEAGEQIIGEKFKQKRNSYQRVLDNLNGNFGREERPEADRYLLFRYVSFFRRFFTSMLMNRFAYSGGLMNGTSRGRYDYALGDTKQGFYIEFLKLLGNTFKSRFKNLPFMSSEEKAASLRVLTEVGTASIIKFLVVPLIFGFSDDDDDRFKKLKAKSGALPAFGITDDPNHPFHFGGWLSNHALLAIMGTNGESSQFTPWPGFGLTTYKQMTDIKSIALSPTLKTAFNLIQDVSYLATGNEKAYYQKDASAYEFAQQGDPKIYNHIAKAFGFNGSTMDPSHAIQLFQNAQIEL